MKTINTLETTETSPVQQALQVAKNQLNKFATSADFKSQMQIALGTQRNWETTDLIHFPAIEIRPAAEINNARGAFAAATNTIYLSQELVNENIGNVGAIASVLLEEYGHYIDAQINAIDSPGDEGELFADLVQGKILNESDILSLRNEDDSAIVVWDGEGVSIEQQATEPTNNSDLDCGELPAEEAPVYSFYINGINTTKAQYDQRDWLQVRNLLDQAGFDESQLDPDTYNLSGLENQVLVGLGEVFSKLPKIPPNLPIVLLGEILKNFSSGDLLQSIVQGSTESSTPEGIEFTNSVIEKINQIEENNQDDAKENCCDTLKPKYLIISHSQGNFFAEDVIKGLDSDIQERTRILAISPFTNFSGVADKVDYLLRSDDFPTLLQWLPGIAIPGNAPNQEPFPGINPSDSHALENYISPNSPEALHTFIEATVKIQDLLKFETDPFSERKENCSPISMSDVTVTEGNEGLPPKGSQAYFTFNSKYYEWEPRVVQPFTGPTGDILSQIALETLGSASPEAFNFIAFHNDISDPDLIIAGSTIEVPKEVPVPETDGFAVFEVSHSGDPNIPVKVTYETIDESAIVGSDYQATSGELSIPAGQGGVVLVPIVGDERPEDTETFQLTLKKQDGTCFGECVSEVTATGTIVNDDEVDEGDTYNDPRLVTFDSKYYDFQAAGEFTLVQSVSGDLKIQVRQEPVDDNPRSNVSDNTAVATLLGGQRVALYRDTQQLLINGNPTVVPDNGSLAVGDGFIERNGNVYNIVYPTGDELVAKLLSSRINIKVLVSKDREGQLSGLLGNNNGNPEDDIANYDGTVLTEPISVEQLYGEYADSWRVSQTESLFDYQPGEDTNTFTISNYPREKVKLSDLDPADIQKAEELIGDRITDPTIRETAIIDLVLTDFDPEVIEAAINVPSPQSSVIIRVDPEAKADFTSTFANTPVKINPLTNDIVTTGIPLSLTGYDQTTAKGGTIQLDNNGTPDDKTDDQLTYTPPTNFVGVDTINYVIADDQKTATGTITVAVPAINLNALNGDNGFAVTGAAGTFAGSSLSSIGDFNGDTIDDFIVGGFAADPNNINATGESYVVFGTNQGFPANFDLSTLNGTNGFIIEGFEAESFSGGAVSSAGDINGDGLKDLIIGAFASDSNSLNDSGRTYVVFGSKQAFSTRFNLANLNGNNGFAINSNQPLDYSGLAVSSAGDFNNDGLDDLAVAAPAGINTFLGKVYIVYGRNNSFPPAFDPSDLQWDDGIVINHNNGLAGTTVSNAGDINGDQIDDLIIGAEQGSLEGNPKGGETYVLFGKDGGYQNGFSLSNLNGTNGFTIKGDGYSVSSVSGAGDINADGLEDIIIGVSQSPGNNQTNAGKAYVVFGTQAGFTQQLDLFTLNGNNGFVINGVEPDELLGGSVKGAGDINGDQIDDIIIGASGATANGVKSAGKTYVVFGSQKGFPASLNSSDLNGEKGFFLNGTAENELSGVAVSSAGDINKDSVNDILIGAPGSLFDNTAGKSYVVFGNSTFGNQAII